MLNAVVTLRIALLWLAVAAMPINKVLKPEGRRHPGVSDEAFRFRRQRTDPLAREGPGLQADGRKLSPSMRAAHEQTRVRESVETDEWRRKNSGSIDDLPSLRNDEEGEEDDGAGVFGPSDLSVADPAGGVGAQPAGSPDGAFEIRNDFWGPMDLGVSDSGGVGAQKAGSPDGAFDIMHASTASSLPKLSSSLLQAKPGRLNPIKRPPPLDTGAGEWE